MTRTSTVQAERSWNAQTILDHQGTQVRFGQSKGQPKNDTEYYIRIASADNLLALQRPLIKTQTGPDLRSKFSQEHQSSQVDQESSPNAKTWRRRDNDVRNIWRKHRHLNNKHQLA